MKESRMKKTAVMAAAIAAASSLFAMTDGWDNINPGRAEFPVQKVLWTADLSQAKMELRDGAEGTMRVIEADGRKTLEIVKTNGKGMIVVTVPPFEVRKGAKLRAYAYCACEDGDPESGEGYIRLYGKKEDLSYFKGLDGRGPGGPRMQKMVNATPGNRIRKLAHRLADDKTGTSITAAIVVSGPPCTSRWSDWGVEDKAESDRAWAKHRKELAPKDTTFGMMPGEAFDAQLAAEPEHTAKVAKVGDCARLFIDGRLATPMIFRGQTSKDGQITFSGGLHDAKGLLLQSMTVRFGRDFRNPLGIWTKDGFDAKAGAEIVRTTMRLAPHSNFIVAFSLNAYPEWVESHPDEAWQLADGRKVYGSNTHADFHILPEMPDGKWLWPSYHSKVWREEVKSHIAELVAELKRQGLSKRIVGVHICGYHDAQFATRHPDFSPTAVAAFIEWQRRHLGKVKWTTAPVFGDGAFLDPEKEPHQVAYLRFVKQGPFHMQEDIARHIKKCFGKDIVVGRYCMGWGAAAFNGALDLDPFVLGNAIDYLVAQPNYAYRIPGVAVGSRIPTRSFHDHGKLFVNEFDLRTYGGIAGQESELRVLGLSQATDFPMWQSIHHKMAGQMMAQRMGWWYLDMSGKWFSPPEIVQDIADVNAGYSRFAAAGRSEPWYPSAAVAVDEQGTLLRNSVSHYYCTEERLLQDQIRAFTSSGAPFDMCLADDLARTPSLGERYRIIFFADMYCKGAARQAMLRHLNGKGVRCVFLSADNPLTPDRFAQAVRSAGGYVPTRSGLEVDMNGDFISVHALKSGHYDFTLPRRCTVINMKTGRKEAAGDTLRLDLIAGETCWFEMRRD